MYMNKYEKTQRSRDQIVMRVKYSKDFTDRFNDSYHKDGQGLSYGKMTLLFISSLKSKDFIRIDLTDKQIETTYNLGLLDHTNKLTRTNLQPEVAYVITFVRYGANSSVYINHTLISTLLPKGRQLNVFNGPSVLYVGGLPTKNVDRRKRKTKNLERNNKTYQKLRPYVRLNLDGLRRREDGFSGRYGERFPRSIDGMKDSDSRSVLKFKNNFFGSVHGLVWNDVEVLEEVYRKSEGTTLINSQSVMSIGCSDSKDDCYKSSKEDDEESGSSGNIEDEEDSKSTTTTKFNTVYQKYTSTKIPRRTTDGPFYFEPHFSSKEMRKFYTERPKTGGRVETFKRKFTLFQPISNPNQISTEYKNNSMKLPKKHKKLFYKNSKKYPNVNIEELHRDKYRVVNGITVLDRKPLVTNILLILGVIVSFLILLAIIFFFIFSNNLKKNFFRNKSVIKNEQPMNKPDDISNKPQPTINTLVYSGHNAFGVETFNANSSSTLPQKKISSKEWFV